MCYIGWEYATYDIPKNELKKFFDTYDWSPSFLDEKQFIIINGLCKGVRANLNGSEFAKIISEDRTGVGRFINDLVNRHALFFQRAIFFAAENKDGKLMKRVAKYQSNKSE